MGWVSHWSLAPSWRGSLGRVLLTEPRRPVAVRESPRAHWYVVGTVCIGAFMGQLDASIVTLALPRLGRDLHASVGAVEWVALAYLLVLVATVATVGRVADAVGRKLLYVYGFGVFTAGSMLCGLAPTLAVLIAARVLQAIGATMLQANSVALIAEAMPRPLLGRGIGVQGTAQALGLALGPVVGGALLALGGWRLIFLVNLPAGAIGLALGWVLLPRSRSRRQAGRGDQLAAVLLALAAAGPLVYLSLAERAGYADPLLLAALVAGLLAAIAFVRRERRVDAPLIELSIFRRPELSIGLSSGLVSYVVLFGTLLVVPYYLSAKHVSFALVGVQLIGAAGRDRDRRSDRRAPVEPHRRSSPHERGHDPHRGRTARDRALPQHHRTTRRARARRARPRGVHAGQQRHDHGRIALRAHRGRQRRAQHDPWHGHRTGSRARGRAVHRGGGRGPWAGETREPLPGPGGRVRRARLDRARHRSRAGAEPEPIDRGRRESALSENRVSVHSAGTAVHGQIDPGVRAVIGELGVDFDKGFARPVTEEVLRAADVIVTMGHSVGVIDIPQDVRHEDWRIGDPVGAPIAEIRRVRADIERRVRTLLSELGVAAG